MLRAPSLLAKLLTTSCTMNLYLRNRVDNSCKSIDENNDSNYGGREEPSGIETNPCEVDTNLLAKVAPNIMSNITLRAHITMYETCYKQLCTNSLSSLSLLPPLPLSHIVFMTLTCMHYRTAGNFGEVFNLVIWRIFGKFTCQ